MSLLLFLHNCSYKISAIAVDKKELIFLAVLTAKAATKQNGGVEKN